MKWIPRHPNMEYAIYIGHSDRLPLYFLELKLAGTVENPYFRESGLPIYFGSHPTQKLYEDWEATWQGSKGLYMRMGPD